MRKKFAVGALVLGAAGAASAIAPELASAHKCDPGLLVVDEGCYQDPSDPRDTCSVYVSVLNGQGSCLKLPS